MSEKRPLPIGLNEFHEWADRIIAGAMLPATEESQKYTLSNMILHMKPTEAFVEDTYFIHSLRKAAANQVADFYRQKVYPEIKARLAAEEAKQNQAEATPIPSDDGKVLAITGISKPETGMGQEA